MKLGLQGENPFEWLYLWLGQKANMVPWPLTHGFGFGLYSRVFITATRLGIFEAVKDSPQTLEQLAQKTGLNAKSLYTVMLLLTKMDYFKYKDGRFKLTRMARKYAIKDAPTQMYNYNHFQGMMLDWADHLEEYLKTGRGQDVHQKMTNEQWHWYQLAMESMATWTAKSAAKNTPVPANPMAMLDIGGSHGLYAVEICRRHPTLKATILDLPEAISQSQSILAKYGMGDRVVYQAGNALEDDLGQEKYDLVLMSSLMHHFTAAQNIEVCKKVVRALKPGGCFAVQEFLKPEFKNMGSPENTTGAVTDLLFNITSEGNTWSLAEIKGFLKEAGLVANKLHKFGLAMPSFIQVSARKV